MEINFNLKVNHARLIKSLNEETTMADTDSIVYNETDSNETLATNVSGREAASREGLATAYIFLFAMALFPIFIGSLRSVVHHYNLKVRERICVTCPSCDSWTFRKGESRLRNAFV